jgi:hypothetical protein
MVVLLQCYREGRYGLMRLELYGPGGILGRGSTPMALQRRRAMIKVCLAAGIVGVALLAGCAGRHEHRYSAGHSCPDCGKEWLDSNMNRVDNGYGSVHFLESWEALRDQWVRKGMLPEDAAAQAQAMLAARAAFWQAQPQIRATAKGRP